MELHLEDYIGRRRDTVRERELASLLRKMPETERFEYIQQAIHKHISVGLQLANSCLQHKTYFLSLLRQGLENADASWIRWWLETVLPHLGARRVIIELTRYAKESPDAVWMALYWLPGLLPKEDCKAREQMKQLVQQLKTEHTEVRSEVEPISATV